ncbi:MAG: hypothetical protein ABR955_06805 [Verrucomicrobiota bacterium]|jgi:Tfp pilus assembly protein FimT
MKIRQANFIRQPERGTVTFVFIALLAIMLMLVAANGHALLYLHREIKLLDQKQIKRLDGSQTNAVVAGPPATLTESK